MRDILKSFRPFWFSFVLICFGVTLVFAQSPAKNVRVTLLQVNDVYQMSPIDKGKAGGLARLATLKKRIQSESPNTLFLLGGDTLSPSVASNIFRGEQMIAAWNAAGLDYAVLGNHEFDFGPDVLLARMRASKFGWLGANVVSRRNGKPFGAMPRYVIREFDGVKVGIFGILTSETATSSSPGKEVKFLAENATARQITRELRAKGVHVIIAITHLTMAQDKGLAKAARLDVIIGGHEHELLQSFSGCTPIFKMGSDARILGRIDLDISKQTRRVESIDYTPIPVTDAIPADEEAAKVIAVYEKQLSAELDKPLGTTTVVLDALQVNNRSAETNLGSFIADAYRKAVNADVALFNAGSIRSNTTYGPGVLTKRDVLSILPFENPVVKVEVTGDQLLSALEHGVEKIGIEKEVGSFPQVSGIRFTYDAAQPPGRRVSGVLVNDVPLDRDRKYSLASVTYLLNGGDGYNMFKSIKYLIVPENARLDAVILADAIQSQGTIAPVIDGRIKRIN